MGDYHPKQLKDRTIPPCDCLKPLAGFSSCVASLKHPNQPHTQLVLAQGKGHKKELHARSQGKCVARAIEGKEEHEGWKWTAKEE